MNQEAQFLPLLDSTGVKASLINAVARATAEFCSQLNSLEANRTGAKAVTACPRSAPPCTES